MRRNKRADKDRAGNNRRVTGCNRSNRLWRLRRKIEEQEIDVKKL